MKPHSLFYESFKNSFKVVVTAMHCVVGTYASQWKITAGHLEKSEYDAQSEPGFQKRKVEKLLKHP